ncbi:PREDICTED: serine-rich adhesin for platelets-like isoform X1 [Acropora digitifera]|uniref:serine-rich adhesin for platelets-like isoform X1 n=1 Tax=Acropora digitifera TaxID=70779 RepID=UPI00077A1255|nr:PREDICTED: serine-rich adhesin for platelets-like isoform X1 [Acropora digitifera]
MKLGLIICAVIFSEVINASQHTCGSVQNNILRSPGYPSNYPRNIHCIYRVRIPLTKGLLISLNYFSLESDSRCRHDYLRIADGSNNTIGTYCGNQTGKSVRVVGSVALLTFHSDGSVQKRGFELSFSFFRQSAACRSVQNNILRSPGYPSNYPNNVDCVNQVFIPLNKGLLVSFNYFSLESHSRCAYDYLRITDDSGNTIGTYCGNQTGKSVRVFGTAAVLTFHTDGSVQRRGYELHFSFFSKSVGCGSVQNNILRSPGYPSYYPNNIHCIYRVHIPLNKGLLISFNHFSLESHSRCGYDYLRITDGSNNTIGTYCGIQIGKSVRVVGSIALLTFHTDGSVQRRGFQLSFSFFRQSPVCRSVQNHILRSPGYPRNYPNNVDCVYQLFIPLNKGLLVFFNYFSLESHSRCAYDYLRITDGSGNPIGTYCGYQTGKSIRIVGTVAVLIFHTDGSTQGRGFELSFTFFRPSPNSSTLVAISTATPAIPPVITTPLSITSNTSITTSTTIPAITSTTTYTSTYTTTPVITSSTSSITLLITPPAITSTVSLTTFTITPSITSTTTSVTLSIITPAITSTTTSTTTFTTILVITTTTASVTSPITTPAIFPTTTSTTTSTTFPAVTFTTSMITFTTSNPSSITTPPLTFFTASVPSSITTPVIFSTTTSTSTSTTTPTTTAITTLVITTTTTSVTSTITNLAISSTTISITTPITALAITSTKSITTSTTTSATKFTTTSTSTSTTSPPITFYTTSITSPIVSPAITSTTTSITTSTTNPATTFTTTSNPTSTATTPTILSTASVTPPIATPAILSINTFTTTSTTTPAITSTTASTATPITTSVVTSTTTSVTSPITSTKIPIITTTTTSVTSPVTTPVISSTITSTTTSITPATASTTSVTISTSTPAITFTTTSTSTPTATPLITSTTTSTVTTFITPAVTSTTISASFFSTTSDITFTPSTTSTTAITPTATFLISPGTTPAIISTSESVTISATTSVIAFTTASAPIYSITTATTSTATLSTTPDLTPTTTFLTTSSTTRPTTLGPNSSSVTSFTPHTYSPYSTVPLQIAMKESIVLWVTGLDVRKWHQGVEENFKAEVARLATKYCNINQTECVSNTTSSHQWRPSYMVFSRKMVHILPGYPKQSPKDPKNAMLAFYLSLPPEVSQGTVVPKDSLTIIVESNITSIGRSMNSFIVSVKPLSLPAKEFQTNNYKSNKLGANHTAAIVGGAFGGCLFLVVIVALLRAYRRRKRPGCYSCHLHNLGKEVDFTFEMKKGALCVI